MSHLLQVQRALAILLLKLIGLPGIHVAPATSTAGPGRTILKITGLPGTHVASATRTEGPGPTISIGLSGTHVAPATSKVGSSPTILKINRTPWHSRHTCYKYCRPWSYYHKN